MRIERERMPSQTIHKSEFQWDKTLSLAPLSPFAVSFSFVRAFFAILIHFISSHLFVYFDSILVLRTFRIRCYESGIYVKSCLCSLSCSCIEYCSYMWSRAVCCTGKKAEIENGRKRSVFVLCFAIGMHIAHAHTLTWYRFSCSVSFSILFSLLIASHPLPTWWMYFHVLTLFFFHHKYSMASLQCIQVACFYFISVEISPIFRVYVCVCTCSDSSFSVYLSLDAIKCHYIIQPKSSSTLLLSSVKAFRYKWFLWIFHELNVYCICERPIADACRLSVEIVRLHMEIGNPIWMPSLRSIPKNVPFTPAAGV